MQSHFQTTVGATGLTYVMACVPEILHTVGFRFHYYVFVPVTLCPLSYRNVRIKDKKMTLGTHKT